MALLDQSIIGGRTDHSWGTGQVWDDPHAHQPRRLALLTEDGLKMIGGLLQADSVLLLSAPPDGDRMRIGRRWGQTAAQLPPELFAPAGSLLAHLSRSIGCSRLRLLPLLSLPGSGQGRRLGSTVAVCDGDGSLLLVARRPHQPAFSAADVGTLRDLLEQTPSRVERIRSSAGDRSSD